MAGGEGAAAQGWLSLLLVSALAFTVPLLLQRWPRVPLVVGEMAAGILFGRSGLGWVQEDVWLEVLSSLGFAYLLFLSGLEIDFDFLLRAVRHPRERRRVFLPPLLYFFFSLALAFTATLLLSRAGALPAPRLLALVLSTTSLGVVLPVLRERRLGPTPFGQTVLFGASLADFGTMMLLTALVALETGGAAWHLFLVLFLLGLFLTLDRLLHWAQRLKPIAPLMAATAHVGVRGAFLLIFLFVVLSEQLGMEVILGAFLAGALIALASGRVRSESLEEKLDAIGFGFFLPMFFIMVGARFDLRALTASREALLLVPLLILLRYGIKVLPALVFRLRFSLRETLAAGILLSPGLTLMIAAADTGLRAGLLDEAAHAAVILLAVVSATLSPLLFHRLYPEAALQPERVLLFGGVTETTLLLARRADRYAFEAIRFLERDPSRAQEARRAGFDVVAADGTRPEELARAGATPASVVVAAGDDPDRNRLCALAARDLGVETVLVTATREPEELQRLGVHVVTPQGAVHVLLTQLIHDPDFMRLLEVEALRAAEVELLHLPATRLRDLPLPPGVLAVSVHRGREHFLPTGETELKPGDRLTLLGQPEDVAAAEQRLRQLGA